MSRRAVPAAVVWAAILLLSCTSRVVGGLDEPEANRVLAALEEAGIPAGKAPDRRGRDGGWAVHVAPADEATAREILERLSLPREETAGFEALVSDTSIVPSASRERLRETVARGEELARTLETLEGVVEASVIIATPEPPSPGSRDEPQGGTASALIRVEEELCISREEVRDLVAGAVPGVEPADVTVVVARAGRPTTHDVAWSRVGPFVVRPASRTPLILSLLTMALLNISLAGWAVTSVVLRRRRRPPAGPGKESRSP
jgi:type III secretion system YscJ/HrcJ family lipoprotein